jgi:hypothetical protein
MISKSGAVFLLFFLSLVGKNLSATTFIVDDFSTRDLSQWQSKEFKGKTIYQISQLNGEMVLKATSNATASGLFKKIDLDLRKTPYLNWRWRIESRLGPLSELEKSGDDYAARVYVVVSTGFFFWQTKALNYAWSSQLKPATSWPNAFAPDNALMIPVRSGNDKLSTWQTEKRNVYQELKQWLGHDDFSVAAIAIMTDTDNSHSQAIAYYDDIYFSSE